MRHLQYAKYLIRHKWFVLVAGVKIGVPLWRLVVHDWSKFLPSEWLPYANYYYGGTPPDQSAKVHFDVAWLLHQNRQPHHWQFWVLIQDSGEVSALEIPVVFLREMVADWAGAGRAINGSWDILDWWNSNADKMQLHPETEVCVHGFVGALDEALGQSGSRTA